ncbi:OLC1v1028441C1 [Oldenlandia corymbosa var. corymbosa]|nr:OLC1v1028441C1 [Oldenlandia corymbosa var. corymbosa]
MPHSEYFSKGLYTFDIGQNDLTAGYFLNMTTDQVQAYVPDVLDQFTTIVKNIYDQGGRSFWIHNTGPVGCLPYVLDRVPITAGQIDEVGCATPFNQVARYFNSKLKEAVIQLRHQLPQAALTYVDIYSIKYDLIRHSKKHGFDHPLRACCGHGGKYNYNLHVGCGGKIMVKGKEVVCSPESLPQCTFPAIFNFGDSNSDTGGLAAIYGQPSSPYGETFFHRPSGRFSDGRLMIDFMAETLGLPLISAYLSSVGSNYMTGANFATAGSTIRPQNTTFFQSGYSPISLDVQLAQFSNFQVASQIARTQQQGGYPEKWLPSEKEFGGALYTIDIAQNDFTAAYELNLSIQQVKSSIPDLLHHFSRAIKDIYAKGGRSFWIHNTGPVGCLAYVMVRLPITAAEIDEYGCATPYNQVAQFYNLKLKEAVAKLRKSLPLAAITYVDIYSVKYYLITRAKKLGFKKPFEVCCGHGGKFNFDRHLFCGKKKMVNGKMVMAKGCRNPSRRIVWDGIHFTEAANKWVFDQIVNGSFSDPPLPLIHACHRIH